jgi:excisionase family DNA binding protein
MESEDDALLTTGEAAKILGVSVRAVQLAISEGRLNAEKYGRDYLIRRSALGRIVRKPAGRPPKSGSKKVSNK